MRTLLLITAALLSVTAPAQAQFPRLFGGSSSNKQAISTGENPNRVMEIQVELAWLADPLSFPYFLEARMEGPRMVVRGQVPHSSVRAHALQIAKMNCTVAVVDGMQENPALRISENSVPATQLYSAILAAIAEGLPQLQPYLHVDCSSDGRVVINGQVPTFEHKLAISQAVRRLNGCTSVANRVQVGPMLPNNANANATPYMNGPGTAATAAGSEAQTRLAPNARGVTVPVRQSSTPANFDPAVASAHQPAPQKSRSFWSWWNGTSPPSTPNTSVVPSPPAPLYPAENQQPTTYLPAPNQQPVTATPVQQGYPAANSQPTTTVNPPGTLPIQQMGYQTFRPGTQQPDAPARALPNGTSPQPGTAMNVGSLTPLPFSSAVANTSRPLNSGTTMQALRPPPGPSGGQSYVTQGIVYIDEPAPKMAPTPVPPIPAVPPTVLQQRVAAACGSDARACVVQVLPGNKLKIDVTVAQPRMVEQRDQIQKLVQRILDLPELQAYQSPELMFQP